MGEQQAKVSEALAVETVEAEETVTGAPSLSARFDEAYNDGDECVAADVDDVDDDVDVDGDGRRRKRRSRARARTISIRRLSKAELNRGRELYPETDYWRPETRGDCLEMERPCPFVACKYHLYIDVHPVRGSIKINFPDVDVWEMTDTCALDIADRGGITLEDVGQIMNLTRERVRQLETAGLAKLQGLGEVERLHDYVM